MLDRCVVCSSLLSFSFGSLLSVAERVKPAHPLRDGAAIENAGPAPREPAAAVAVGGIGVAAARTPAQARAESVIASKPAGLLPDHLRNDLRTSGPKARGGRTPLAEPRHLRSEVGNVIFGIPSDASAAATTAGGLSSPRRATTAADSYASPAERRDTSLASSRSRAPTRGARSHLSMSYKHTRSTADGVIFNRDTAAEIPSIDPSPSRAAVACGPPAARAPTRCPSAGQLTTTRRAGRSTRATWS